jgi:hypothetical protein
MHSRDGWRSITWARNGWPDVREAVRVAREEGSNAGFTTRTAGPPVRPAAWCRPAAAMRSAQDGDPGGSRPLPTEDDDVLAVFRGTVAGDALTDWSAWRQWPLSLADGQRLLILRREISGPSEWGSTTTPTADNTQPRRRGRLHRHHLRAYRREIARRVRQTVPGIFTGRAHIFAPRSVRAAGAALDRRPAGPTLPSGGATISSTCCLAVLRRRRRGQGPPRLLVHHQSALTPRLTPSSWAIGASITTWPSPATTSTRTRWTAPSSPKAP